MLLQRLFTKCWNAVLQCGFFPFSHNIWLQKRRSDVQFVLLVLKVSRGVGVRSLWRMLKFFHVSLSKPSLHGPSLSCWNRFVLGSLVLVKGHVKATAYKDILNNCVLSSLWQKLREGSPMGVMISYTQLGLEPVFLVQCQIEH